LRKPNPGIKAERRVLKKIGAKRQPNSGATPGMPNDGVKGKYLIEVKSTATKRIGIYWKDLDALEENAMMRSKIPALVMVMNAGENIWPYVTKEYVAIPLHEFEKLTLGWRTR
jgi:hypothetical protein